MTRWRRQDGHIKNQCTQRQKKPASKEKEWVDKKCQILSNGGITFDLHISKH